MYCRNCGRELTNDALYCDRCGTPTNQDKTISMTWHKVYLFLLSITAMINFMSGIAYSSSEYGVDLIEAFVCMMLFIMETATVVLLKEHKWMGPQILSYCYLFAITGGTLYLIFSLIFERYTFSQVLFMITINIAYNGVFYIVNKDYYEKRQYLFKN